MDHINNTLCCGCLCSGRKMVKLDERRKHLCFSQVIEEICPSQHGEPFKLCWECHAQINRFLAFTAQVQTSYKLFKQYTEHKTSLSLEPKPRLTLRTLPNFDILPGSEKKEKITESIEMAEIAVKIEDDPIPEPDISTEDCDVQDSISEEEIESKKTRVKKRKRKVESTVYEEIELTKEEIEEERRVAMLKEHYVNAMFKCEKCILSFPNAEDLKDHENMKHKTYRSNHKCSICACSFNTEVSYNYHMNRHTIRYKCVICNLKSDTSNKAIRHFTNSHQCGPPLGLETQSETENPKEHRKYINDTTFFPCEFCDKKFRWMSSLRKHSETHKIETGQKRKPFCKPCGITFSTTANLQKHVKTSSKHHIQLKLWKLNQSPNSLSLETHGAVADKIKSSVNRSRQTHPCPQCDMKFQWKGNLVRHINSHVARATGKLVCEPCNRTFSSIATYRQHMKISMKHVSENDFKYMCSDCGKRFANKIRLKDHVDWEHLKNYVHTCDVCQKVFKSHTSLYLHKQVVHNKDNPEHLCHHCGKAFPNHSKLRTHIAAVHSGQAPLKCNICNATFKWHSCLSRHIRKLHRDKLATTN